MTNIPTVHISPFTRAAFEAVKRHNVEDAKHHRETGIVVGAIIKAFLDLGLKVSVNDGEETTVKMSQSYREIIGATFSTDQDYLIIHNDKLERIGTVWLVYGNGSWEVAADYTDHPIITKIIETVGNKYEERFMK